MAYICHKPAGSCPTCSHYRRDEEEARMVCFAELDEVAKGQGNQGVALCDWCGKPATHKTRRTLYVDTVAETNSSYLECDECHATATESLLRKWR